MVHFELSMLKSRTGVGLAIIITWVAFAALVPFLTSYSPNSIDLHSFLLPPSLSHPLGTDNFGRDTFVRLVYGAQVTFQVILIVAAVMIPAGMLLGLVSYYSKMYDAILNVVIDTMLSLPGILFALLIVAGIGPGTFNVSVAIGISQIPIIARITRSGVISLKNVEYVEGAIASGETSLSVLTRYILANSYQPIVVQSIIRLGGSVVGVAALSFIGLGVQIPQAEWGAMMVNGAAYLSSAPQLVLYPGLALVSLVMGFNLLGDGLQFTLREVLRK